MNYRLSNAAEQDIADIYLYSYWQFGETKAEHYHQSLLEHFESLAQNPAMGRDFSFIKAHIRRPNCVSHAVYYRAMGENVLIFRVLHKSRDLARHL